MPHAVLAAALAAALAVPAATAAARENPKPMTFTNAWKPQGGTWSRNGTEMHVKTDEEAVNVRPGRLDDAFEAAVTVRAETDKQAGLLLTPSGEHAPAYFLGLDPANSRALFARRDHGAKDWTLLVIRNAPVKAGAWYRLRLVARGWRLQGFLHGAGVTPPKPEWPFFDVNEAAFGGGTLALRAEGPADFKDVSVGKAAPLPKGPTYTNAGGLIPDIADPDVIKVGETYYAYGTGGHGIRAYESRDLVHWSPPVGVTDGYALAAKDSWGTRWFWAPEVIPIPGGYRMHYTVEEHLAVADGPAPLGPFAQKVKAPLQPDRKEIDSHPFTDDDGKQYLYFVRWDERGSHIYVAEMTADGTNIKPDTIVDCIGPDQPWEHTRVNEGPWVLKHKGTYYLMYSGNGYSDWDYGLGYATASSPTGPWKKYAYNPVLASNVYVHGAGHHAVTRSPDGAEMFVVYHTHRDTQNVHPRKMAIDRMRFVPNPHGGPDIIEIYGPTLTPQPMPSGSPEAPAP